MQISLKGNAYFLELEWHEKTARWFMHIFDAFNNPIVLGIKLLRDLTILDNVSSFPANAILYAKSNVLGQPNFDNLSEFSVIFGPRCL